jgi:hypothetical protein
MLEELWTKIQDMVQNLNAAGVPLPMVRDPKTGRGSVSLSLVVMSSVMVVLGLVGRWSGKLGTVDINNALEFFYASSALYFGRNWKTSRLQVSDNQTSETKEDPSASGK